MVGHLQHFAQLVGDEDDRFALFDQLAHDHEQLVGFLRGQHRGGLVKDEDARLAVEQLDNLDALLHPHGQIAHVGVGFDLQLVTLGNFEDARGGLVAVQKISGAHQFGPEHDVLGDGEDGDEHEMLVDHAHAGVDRVGGRMDNHLFPIHKDFALVRLVKAVEDVHQGGFARAVFPQQGKDFTLFEGEVNMIVGQHTGEAFGNTLEFENRSHRHSFIGIIRELVLMIVTYAQ